MRPSQCFLWIMVTCIGFAAAAALLDAATGWSLTALGGLAPTLLIIAACSVPAAACARVAERGRVPVLMWSGCIACGIAALFWIAIVYGVGGREIADDIARVASVPSIGAIALMIVGLLSLPYLGLRPARVIRAMTVVLVIATSMVLMGWIWLQPVYEARGYSVENRFHETMARTSGVLGILTLCGVASTWIFAHTRRLTGETIPEHERLSFSITCPRCAQRTSLRTGGDACRFCGLRVKVNPA